MIIAEQIIIPSIGTNGTNGVLKGLTLFGSFLRITMMPAQTITNASRVPMLVSEPVISHGINVANAPTNKNNIAFDLYGVLNFGCNSENTFGSKPSFAIE